jgi:hypothetical protein
VAAGDLVQNVLIRFSSDTSKAGKAIANLGVAVSAVTSAFKIASGMAEHFLERTQLSMAGSKFSIDELKKASDGLISNMDLLRLSAAAANTDFKITQEQLNTVARYMIVLRSEGNKASEVMDRVTQSIVEGNSRALKDFGEIIEGSTGKLSTHTAILEEMDKRVVAAGGNIKIAGKEYMVAGVEMTDAMDELKSSLGELAAELAPAIKALAELVVGVIRTAKTIARYMPGTSATRLAKRRLAAYELSESARNATSEQRSFIAGILGMRIPTGRTGRGLGGEAMTPFGPAEYSGLTARVMAPVIRALNNNTKATNNNTRSRGGGGRMMLGGNIAPTDVSTATGAPSFDLGGELAQYPGELEKLRYEEGVISDQIAAERAAAKLAGGRSYLQDMFGPLEEFKLYQNAFATLQGAAAQAFQAWMDGSKSVSKAFKDMLRTILKGLATQMLSESLKHAAMAIGSVAMRDYEGAKSHGLAAAAFAAGAVTIGTYARATGGGGGGAVAGATSAASGIGGGGVGVGQTTANIFIGNDFGPFDRRERAQALERDLKSLNGTDGVRYG